MTNLYRVIDTKTRETAAEGFSNKMEAKAKRDELNGHAPTNDGKGLWYIVSRDIGHPLGESNGTSKRLRGRNSNF